MRRWLVLFMLVLMPLQVSWGAVAAYCGYESGEATQHLGHHEHANHGHEASVPGDAADPDDGSATPTDGDCGHCHGQHAGAVYRVPASLPEAYAGPRLSSRQPPRAAHAPPPPERPQWARLA